MSSRRRVGIRHLPLTWGRGSVTRICDQQPLSIYEFCIQTKAVQTGSQLHTYTDYITYEQLLTFFSLQAAADVSN